MANFFAPEDIDPTIATTHPTADNTESDPHETDVTFAQPIQAIVETNDTTASQKCAKNTRFSLAKAMAVSIGTPHRLAKVTAVSHERLPIPVGGGGAWPGVEMTRKTRH